MLPSGIHIRTKTVLYLLMGIMLIYLWHRYNQDEVQRLLMYRVNHSAIPYVVNFKHLLIACVLAAQKGGLEVKKAREQSNLKIQVKGRTKEGVLDVLTTGDKRSNMIMVNSLLYTIPGIKIISEEENAQTSHQDFDDQDSEIIELLKIDRHLNDEEYRTIPDDIQLNVDDLVVWIDPLDATKEYSEGLTEFVTTMVCVANRRNGEPIIGVIHQPFTDNNNKPSTYWATKFGIDKKLLNNKFSDSKNNQTTSKNPLRIIISRSHKGDIERWIKGNQNFRKEIPDFTLIEAAGSGYKTLQLLMDKADLYLHRTFIKKWDICAPNVLVKYASNGGQMVTLNHGDKIRYGFYSDVGNPDGVFATKNSELIHLRQVLMNET